MKLSSLLLPGEYLSSFSADTVEVESVTTSHSSVKQGSLFICLRGTRYDTHSLLSAVQRAGAVAALVEADAEYCAPNGFPIFAVKNTRRAFAYVMSRFCDSPAEGMQLIAVTGTNGKTSTATMLYTVLHAAGFPAAMIGTVSCHSAEKCYSPDSNSEPRRTMTTPDPDILYPMLADMKRDGIRYVIMEASSHALALDKLAPIHFSLGIFTNLSPEHLDFHRTMEDYLAAKAKLFRQCKCGVINFDSEYAEALVRDADCELLKCGVVRREPYGAEDIVLRGAAGVSYTFASPAARMAISLPIPGAFTVSNSLLALTAALCLGVEPRTAKAALSAMEGVPGRMERLPLPADMADFTVFIDYAHTEAALRNLLVTVSGFRRKNERIVLVFGCGGDRDTTKRAPMGRVAEELADRIIVTSDNCRTEDPTVIIHDILQGMRNREKRRVIVNRRRAIEHAVLTAERGDIILLVGKGHEEYELADGGRSPFSERAVVEEALELRRKERRRDENPT